MLNIKHHLAQLDASVDYVFIPAVTDGHACTADERLLLSLPVKKGGLAISIFSILANYRIVLNSWLNVSTIKTAQHQ